MALVVLVFAFLIVLISITSSQSDLVDSVIACDVINYADQQLLFTIEGTNEPVYSEHLETYLDNGTTIRVYRVDGHKFALDQRPIRPTQLMGRKLTLLYQNEMAGAHPWLITVGQSDDDEHIEVFVGAFRATLCFPAETRPYFLEYRDGV